MINWLYDKSCINFQIMCLKPIQIINQSKYCSIGHRDRFLYSVPCGQCCECQQTARNVWYYRAYHEFQDCIARGGYVYFDCLTYRPNSVPYISDYFDIDSKLDAMCFDYEHLRLFFVRLRRRLRHYNIEKNIRYFAASEYGTSNFGTHRPHLHLLLYVNSPSLSPLILSKAIADCWPYGRTDGLPYKSRKYVLNNVISTNIVSAMRVCKYVSKYVMKDSSFQKVIDSRINNLMYHLYKNSCSRFSYEEWLYLPDTKLLKRSVVRHIGQFHRQSLHFGEVALRDIDIDDVMQSNCLTIVDSKQVVMRIPLPTYYKRKLFFQLVEVDGIPTWIPTDFGKKYISLRQSDLASRLTDEYMMMRNIYKVDIPNVPELVDYIINYRGRIAADAPSIDLEEKLKCDTLVYPYVTIADRKQFHSSFVTAQYLGNRKQYFSSMPLGAMPLQAFINEFVYLDARLETIIEQCDNIRLSGASDKQRLYDNKQRLLQVYKNLSASRFV